MISIFRVLRHLVVGLSAAAAILVPVWFVASAFRGKYGIGGWQPIDGFLHVIRNAGLPDFGGGLVLPLTVALGGIALAIVIIFRVVFGRANAPGIGGYVAPIAALFVGGAPMLLVELSASSRSEIPPIHDISTDTQNPPQFSAALIDRRGPDANPVHSAGTTVREDSRYPQWAGRPLPEVQAEAYPEIQPMDFAVEPALVYEAALNTARDMGWKVGTESEAAGMFEATDTSFWFGFKDDVVVRVTALEDGGSRVDARSVSRVGVSDLGANAARLEAFETRLRSSLGEGA